MVTYIGIIIFIIFLGAVIRPDQARQRKTIFLFIIFNILVFLAGWRAYTVGVDTKDYVELYQSIDSYDISSGRFEIGFIYLFKILSKISSNPRFMLIITSAICIGCVCFFIKKFSKDTTLSVLLYLLLRTYFCQMNTMRQALAISISLVAITFILKKKTKCRVIATVSLILLAGTLHTVAYVIFIPLAIWLMPHNIIMNKLTPMKSVKWAIVLSFFAFLLFPLAMKFILDFLPQYAYYFNSEWSDSNYFASLLQTTISFVFLVAGAVYFNRKTFDETRKFAALMMIFYMIFATLSMRMEIWERITGVFSIYNALLWTPSFVKDIRNKRQRFFVKGAIVSFSFIYLIVIFTYRPEWDGVVPYINSLFY